MAKIVAARPSPRITNGIIAWYCMDEFEIGLSIKLYDADGEEISLGTEDTVEKKTLLIWFSIKMKRFYLT